MRPAFILMLLGLAMLMACATDDSDNGRASSDDDSSDDDDTDDDDAGDCVTPYYNMRITRDTVICPRSEPYEIGDANSQGVIVVAGSDLTLTGDGVTLQGDGKGVAIKILDTAQYDVVIRGFSLVNYHNSIQGHGEFEDLILTDMTIEESANMHIDINVSSVLSENRRIVMQNLTVANSHNTGIACTNCFDSVLRNIESTNDVADIMESNLILFNGADNRIEDNVIYTRNEIGCNAIWVCNSDRNVIQNNELDLGVKDGSHLHGGQGNIYRYNTIRAARSDQNPIAVADYEPTAALAGLMYGSGANYNLSFPDKGEPAGDNQFYGNTFYNGILDDQGVNSIFCVEGVGNEYLEGAIYNGPDANGGTCP